MIYSMTGFGRGIAERDGHKVMVEIRSLNGKQLDLSLRLPHQFRAVDMELRKVLRERLLRGKVDVTVRILQDADAAEVKMDTERMYAYWKQIESFCSQYDMPFPSDVTGSILRMPEVFANPGDDAENEVNGSVLTLVHEAMQKAIDALDAFREQEGAMLGEVMRKNIECIRSLYARIGDFETQRITDIRERLLEQLKSLEQLDLDKGRLEQEMIYYIEKLDITEEKKRLENHLSYFLQTMEEKGTGKKLQFISQEIGREINTMGSKSNQADMQRLVVEMKDELEQIKEQVLNVL